MQVKDVVCGMTIDAEKAFGTSDFGGETFYFCSANCKEKFDQNPEKFVEKKPLAEVSEVAEPTVEIKSERVDLPITGMTCAACANRIEKKLNKQKGVEKASVNFSTSKATVNFDATKTSISDLINTVKDVGYDTAGTSKIEFVVDDSAARPVIAAPPAAPPTPTARRSTPSWRPSR